MKKNSLKRPAAYALGLLLLIASVAGPAVAQPRMSDLFGVRLRLGMSRDAAHRLLRKVAQFDADKEDKRRRQEVWTLNADPRYSNLLVGYDTDYKVCYVTAKARAGGSPVAYEKVGPLAEAKSEGAGDFRRYRWQVTSGKKGGVDYSLYAQGRDARHLESLSIERDRPRCRN